MADEGNDKTSGGLPEAEPRGYFEGESMTRRNAFAVGGQALGGLAAAGIILPAVGFALAPIFKTPKETWQAVGPTGAFKPDTYKSVVITIVEGIGEAGRSTAYIRKRNEKVDTDKPDQYNNFIAIRTGCIIDFISCKAFCNVFNCIC